jgi:hypothetical protein
MKAKTIAVLVLSFVPSIVAACSSEEAAAPSRPPVPPPSTSSSGGTGDADGGGNGEGGASMDCFDAKTAKPSAPKEFLNQCNGGECFGFDNGTRIEGWTPGSPLPALN